MQIDSVTPFEWVSTHLQVIGWPSLVYAVFKVTRFVTKLEDRAVTVEAHVTKMATNCFPTMQHSLQNQDGLLKSMDGSLKQMANALSNRK